MSEMIVREANFFMTSFVYGIFLMAVYDMLRILRRTIRHGAISVAVEDLLFWVVGSILFFRMIYEKNAGIIRGCAFLAMTMGMCIYHYTISRYVVAVGYGVFGRPIKKIYTFLWKALKKIKKAVKLLLGTREQ